MGWLALAVVWGLVATQSLLVGRNDAIILSEAMAAQRDGALPMQAIVAENDGALQANATDTHALLVLMGG